MPNSALSERDYWVFETKDDKGNNGLTGGIMQRQSPLHSITNYISISSIGDYSSKVEQFGGKIIILKPRCPKWDI